LKAGQILRVRRGLYATVPRGTKPQHAQVDPYLVAGKLTDDAVIAYHAALQFHGKAHTIWRRYHYLTGARRSRYSFQEAEFVPVQTPSAVRHQTDMGGGIVESNHAGGVVRVTSLERTLVDVLDAPNKGGGWEEVWQSLEAIEFFDLDEVVKYLFKLGSALTAARVGFFLDQHRDALMVEDRYLDEIRERAPAQPLYIDTSRRPGKLVPGWNLVVPNVILDRTWEDDK
jgi:predicted transcriptional regulator of viral defense system